MEIFGLIGYPLDHSWSAGYFAEKFKREGVTDKSYHLFPLKEIGGLDALLRNEPELHGFNVTIPHKVSILSHLDEIDREAADIGAVNTVKIYREKQIIRLKGFNTDGVGFLQSLPDPLHHSKALILGTGGASKAVAWALKNRGIEVRFVSRAKQYPDFLTYEGLNGDVLEKYSMIINTTPAGMFPDVESCPELPYHLLTRGHFLYDLVYNPSETLFLRKGKEAGAETQNGLPMLINQAEAAYRIFTSDPHPAPLQF